MQSATCNDATFGPVSTCRFFDFTLAFQNALLLFPSSLLVIFSLVEIVRLSFEPTLIAQGKSPFRGQIWRNVDTIGIIRCSLALLHAVIAIALLGLVSSSTGLENALTTPSILAALSMSMISAVLLVPFSFVARQKLPHGSLLIPLYLFAAGLIDACRIRTYLGVPLLRHSSYTSLTIVLFIIKMLMLIAENTSGIVTMQSTRESSASFISKMLFLWTFSTIWTGFRRPLQMVNIENLAPEFEGRGLGERLALVWNKAKESHQQDKRSPLFKIPGPMKGTRIQRQNGRVESIEMRQLHDLSHIDGEGITSESTGEQKKQSTGPNLLWICFKAFPRSMLAPVVPKICMSGITLALPYLIRSTLGFAESYANPSTEQPTAYGWGLVGGYGFVYLILAFSTGQFYWACDRNQVKLRGALLDMIYRKSLRLHLSEARTVGGGAAANLMAVDLERFCRAVIPFHSLWSGLLVTAVASYLLYRELGVAFFATLFTIILCLSFPPIASRGVGKRQGRWSQCTDRRVNLTSSAIANARGVKFMAYEAIIVEKLIEQRAAEIKQGWSYYKQLLVISGFTNLVTEIMAVVTYTTIALIDYISGSHRLNIDLVVTSLTLMTILQEPLLQMGQHYASIVAALVSLKRIGEFLAREEQPTYSISSSSRHGSQTWTPTQSMTDSKRQSESVEEDDFVSDSDVAAFLQTASVGWTPSKPVLINVNLTIPMGKVTMICGTLASGKSTLLQTLLGETNVIGGTVHLPMKREKIAYVAQDGWLQEGATIRDNIIFDAPFDAERYQTVIHATALHIDLSELPSKDRSLAKSLSGGQRQRLTLARALYADADSYLLDDFTSALDAETATHVWDSLIGSRGLLRGKTVVMATNAIQFLHLAALIVRLDDGRVVESGAYQDLSDKGKVAVSRTSMHTERSLGVQEAVKNAVVRSVTETEDDKPEDVEQGTIKWSVYGTWFKAMGLIFFFGAQAGNLLRTTGIMGWNTYLQFWGRASMSDLTHEHTLQWMGGFIGVIFTTTILFGFHLWIAFYAPLVKAGTRLHTAEVKGVFGAGLSFFENNPSGRIINRFSQDIFILDWEIVLAFCNFTGCLFDLFGQMLLLMIPVPYLTAVNAVVLALYVGIQRLYAPTSRQLRRLEMAAKSPIYTLFSETTSPAGLATIRGLRRQEYFIDVNIGRLNRSQQPYLYLQAVRRWLQTWLNLLSLVINVSLVAIVVLLRNTSSIGVLGVGLVQATQISMNLNQSLVAFTDLEIASVALERVLAFAALPKEQGDFVDGKERVKITPEEVRGEIEFRNVDVSYKADAKPALNSLSLTIRGGEKLGVCGRSGSGKSTMLLAIFGMLEASQGDIYLDGQPISKMSAFSLRNSLTIVPQNALILTATVRENLDPKRERTDAEIWDALTTCHLLDVVKTFPDGLDTMLANDVNLSAGQRQLFSLTRALLRRRKVLVLDEATSSMDYETDAAVQQVLRKQFNDCTIITVAHRIATVRDYDRILVLSAGRIAELDHPDKLMEQPTSIFRSLAREQAVS